MSTFPFCKSVAVWCLRAVRRLPVGMNRPVAGSYTSAEVRAREPDEQVGPTQLPPPAISTFPFGSGVAVWSCRGAARFPDRARVPVAGLNTSAAPTEFNLHEDTEPSPPAISTLPFAVAITLRNPPPRAE